MMMLRMFVMIVITAMMVRTHLITILISVCGVSIITAIASVSVISKPETLNSWFRGLRFRDMLGLWT